MKKYFAALLIFSLLFFCTTMANAQSPTFNHTTVYVTNLQQSTEFYEKVMKLEKIQEPFKDGRHSWFRIGEHGQLHVVSGAKAIIPHDINIHLSFHVAGLKDFMDHLDKMNVKYGNWKGNSKTPELRPDGVHQIYFQDPDGYWIEVNDDKF